MLTLAIVPTIHHHRHVGLLSRPCPAAARAPVQASPNVSVRRVRLHGGGGSGQREVEGAAPAERRVDPDSSPMVLNDSFCDVKPQARALATLVLRLMPVAIEDTRDLIGRNPWSVVADGDAHHRAPGLAHDTNLAARGRELDGVADEVRQHLHDALAIA